MKQILLNRSESLNLHFFIQFEVDALGKFLLLSLRFLLPRVSSEH